MNKQNHAPVSKCKYCHREAQGIIYRPNNSLNNVYSCKQHATTLFIPFKKQQKNFLKTNILTSPIRKQQLEISRVSDTKNSKHPQEFFQKLMSNIIIEFNAMKSQVLNNYYSATNLEDNPQAINFKMEGDQANPYMIIHQDQDMLMNAFNNRLMGRYIAETMRQKQESIRKRRTQLSRLLSSGQKDEKLSTKLQNLKMVNSVITARSNECSPQTSKEWAVRQQEGKSTEKKASFYRNLSKTQRAQENKPQQNHKY